MATFKEAKEYVVDLLLDYIVQNARDYDEFGNSINLNEYRRYINPATGQVTAGSEYSENKNLVLYETDFRDSGISPYLLQVVEDIVINCLDADGLGENYDTSLITPEDWTIVYGGNECLDDTNSEYNFLDADFGGISISGPDDTDLGNGSGGCGYTYGKTSCDYLGQADKKINLVLTTDVLESLSQFIQITQQQTNYTELADEILDRNIYELVPGAQTRQQQIDNFFATYERLKGTIPNFDADNDGNIDEDFDSSAHSETNDIVNNPIEGNITRLNEDAENTVNEGKTLQSLRDDLNTFLEDLEDGDISSEDDRDEYQNKSGGYLKFRGLNQAIIIRSTEGTDVGLENYKSDGFTITMWVRFLDKVSNGTLFNYGNPLRADSPDGFMLETLIDTDEDSDNRYLRLVLISDVGGNGGVELRDSHVGTADNDRIDTTTEGLPLTNVGYTKVPIDFNEWYFIVASFNPSNLSNGISEDISFGDDYSNYIQNEDFWRNNVNLDGTFTANSGLGAMCKVEVISKSDLLRARGYQG